MEGILDFICILCLAYMKYIQETLWIISMIMQLIVEAEGSGMLYSIGLLIELRG